MTEKIPKRCKKCNRIFFTEDESRNVCGKHRDRFLDFVFFVAFPLTVLFSILGIYIHEPFFGLFPLVVLLIVMIAKFKRLFHEA